VAGFTCLVGATGVLWLKGVYALAKTSAQAWAVGDIIYWDNTR
jgi:predicted RecA/RadA family phage recombinase